MPEPESGIHLRLFGPVQVLRAGQPLALPVRKTLALLVILALEGSSSRALLSQWLWPDLIEAAARRNLRHALYRLREAGLQAVLQIDNEQVLVQGLSHDLAAFERAVGADQLAQARALRVGPLLHDLDLPDAPAFNDWLALRRERFARQWQAATAAYAAQLRQAGEPGSALPICQQMVDDDLLNEPAALELMRIQIELGDHAGAMRAYQRLTDALRDELGIAPSGAAQALARRLEPGRSQADQLIASAPAAAPAIAPAVAPAGLPATIPFIARGAAQAQIEAAWAQGQRVYLHGVAGAGKTRLACELAAARGPWLRVACEPQDAELPYSSIVRLLRAAHQAAPDVELPAWVRRELAQLMPELGPPPEVLATDEARQRLLAAAAECWRLLVHDNFSAVVLDDWHWGDSASVTLWASLDETRSASAAQAPVAWLISHRSAQLPAAALQRQRADVDSGRGVAVGLEGMQAEEVLALTQALSGAGGARLFSQRLHQATAGNPFFLLETLRQLFAQGVLTATAAGWHTPFDDLTQDYAELPIPASVHAAVLARVRALGPSVQQPLELACLCHGPIDARQLAGAGEVDESAVVAALEHAQAAQLLQELPGPGGGWRFAHDLVRQALQRSLTSARKAMLHVGLAQQLERGGAAPALVAAHWESAQQPEAAQRWRVAAAESALRVHALSEALAQYDQALANGAAGMSAAHIHLARAQLQGRQGDQAAADASFAAAIEHAARAAAPIHAASDEANAVLPIQLAQIEYLVETDRCAPAQALLDALAADIGSALAPLRARALGAEGSLSLREGRYNDAQGQLQRALELLEPLPQARAQMAALLLEVLLLSRRQGQRALWGRLGHRAVALHRAINAPHGLALALTQLGAFHLESGERAAGLAATEQARQLAQRCGLVQAQRSAIIVLVEDAFDVGDIPRALQLLDEGQALPPVFAQRQTELNFLAARCYAHQQLGELAPALAASERLLLASATLVEPMLRLVYLHIAIEVHLVADELPRARALLAQAQVLNDSLQARAEGNPFDTRQVNLQAQLALSEGRAGDALALLPPATASAEDVRDRFESAWIGCAAARLAGDLPQARQRLASVSLSDEVGGGLLALWLEQSLGLAAQTGQADAAALDKARQQLANHQVPPLMAARLQAAVDALQPQAGTASG